MLINRATVYNDGRFGNTPDARYAATVRPAGNTRVKLKQVMQPTYYIVSGGEWTVGQVISEDDYRESHHKSFFVHDPPAEWANDPNYMARRKTEFKLETRRAEKYGELPSRENALFLNTNEDAARRWLCGCRRGNSIYELNPKCTEKAFTANFIWFNYIVRLHKDANGVNQSIFSPDVRKEIEGSLDAYWNNGPSEKLLGETVVEVLFVGELTVTRKID